MRKRKKIKEIRKVKRKLYFLVLFLFLLIFFFMVLLNSYLFDIQRKERLSTYDFKKYTITYYKENRCQIKERVKKDNVTYFYDCLDMVYVIFGTTEITFEEAILEGYLNLTSLLENTTLKEKEESFSVYEKKVKKEELSYLIKVKEDEEKNITVIISPNEKESIEE